MKKLGLFITAMLVGLASATVSAEVNYDGRNSVVDINYRYAQPITFIERGIEFMIFPDGSFDFIDGNYISIRENRLNTRRSAANSAPGNFRAVRYTKRTPRTYIGYNQFGDIIQVNDIYIDYDRSGKVRRIGSVNIGYQRGNNRLKHVGKLKVNYNHWGEIVHIKGHVNRYNSHSNLGIKRNKTEHFECDDYDDGYYYYKKNGKRHKQKKRGRNSR